MPDTPASSRTPRPQCRMFAAAPCTSGGDPIRTAPTYPHTGGLGPACCPSTAPVESTNARSSLLLGSHVLSTAGPSSWCADSFIVTAVDPRTPARIGPGHDTASSSYRTTSGRSSATYATASGCAGPERERRSTYRVKRTWRSSTSSSDRSDDDYRGRRAPRYARPGRGGYSQPCSSATRTASARLRASSFCIAEERWLRTVPGDR